MTEFEKIYRAYFSDVYCYIRRLSGDEQTAEEITSETFFKAMRAIGTFRGDCDIRVWLCQIAKHLWYQHLRKRRREAPMPETGIDTPLPSAEDDALDRTGHLDLLRRVHALPDPGREVVYLRSFGGLSFREIGDVLGRTEVWARVTFHRGREALRKGGDEDEK